MMMVVGEGLGLRIFRVGEGAPYISRLSSGAQPPPNYGSIAAVPDAKMGDDLDTVSTAF